MGKTGRAVERRIDLVEIRWHGLHEFEDDAWVSRVLDLLGKHLPLAMPTRFTGGFGPARTPFDGTGPVRAQFEALCRSDPGQVFWRGASPGYGGHISGLASAEIGWANPAKFNNVDVSLEAGAAEQALGSNGLHALLGGMIEAIGAVYVLGTWQRGLLYNAVTGEGWSDNESQRSATDYILGSEWQGLPWDHVWLEWFNPDYVPLVATPLAGLAVPLVGGLLAEYGWDERDRFRRMPRNLITASKSGGRAQVVPAGW